LEKVLKKYSPIYVFQEMGAGGMGLAKAPCT